MRGILHGSTYSFVKISYLVLDVLPMVETSLRRCRSRNSEQLGSSGPWVLWYRRMSRILTRPKGRANEKSGEASPTTA
jgi:hypothetical protein